MTIVMMTIMTIVTMITMMTIMTMRILADIMAIIVTMTIINHTVSKTNGFEPTLDCLHLDPLFDEFIDCIYVMTITMMIIVTIVTIITMMTIMAMKILADIMAIILAITIINQISSKPVAFEPTLDCLHLDPHLLMNLLTRVG